LTLLAPSALFAWEEVRRNAPALLPLGVLNLVIGTIFLAVNYASARAVMDNAYLLNIILDAWWLAVPLIVAGISGEVQPQLTTKAAHNPQWINGAIITQTRISFHALSTFDTWMPTIIGTDENDISLVYNYSTTTSYPSIVMAGRKATDAQGRMSQLTSGVTIISGTYTNSSGRWGDYSACAVTLNSVTRGGIWRGGECTGSQVSPGWNTRLYNFRTK
jgi:hypothetical protein